MVKEALAATLIAGTLAAAPVPASAETASCKATYEITSTWPTTSAREANMLGHVAVYNTSRTPIKGWQVSWRYTDNTVITQVWGAVHLPAPAIVGAYAFGNERYNGELPGGGSTVFGFAARGPVPHRAPEIICRPIA